MMLSEALFSGEGGYVLKPPGMKPNDPIPRLPLKTLDLRITVLAASSIPLPDDDDKPSSFEPYVKVEVHTAGDSTEEIKRKTKTKRGIDVYFGPDSKKEKTKDKLKSLMGKSDKTELGETLVFEGIKDVAEEKLSFVRIKIHDEEFGRDDMAAWACVRIDRVQEGWRAVRLFDSRGKHSKGIILVKVEKKLY